MARIQSYPLDTAINDEDIVIGSDGAVGANYATKNYTVASLKGYINNGFATEAYVDQAEADANTYTDQAEADANTYTDNAVAGVVADTNKQKIIGVTESIEVGVDINANEIGVINFKAVTGDPSNGSLNFNSANNTISINTNGEITNTSIADVILRISMTSFVSVGQSANNSTVDYILQVSTGGPWSDVKLVERTKSAPGEYADSFWSYFKLSPAHKFRVGFRANNENIILNEFSQFEFEVQ